jgi:hypothetical protein
MGDPVKYASTIPASNDADAKEEFWKKCKAMCFPLELPRDPEE